MDTWDLIKNFILIPVLSAIAWFGKQQFNKLQSQEQRIIDTEREIAVIKSQMDAIHKDIDEIKTGINRLVDKLL